MKLCFISLAKGELHFGRAETSLGTKCQTSLAKGELHPFDEIKFAIGEVFVGADSISARLK